MLSERVAVAIEVSCVSTCLILFAALTQAFDPANIQFVSSFQLNQFVSACDVSAVQPSVRNMPGIIWAAMQSNRESLFSKFRQGVIEFRSHYSWQTGVRRLHIESFTDNESKDCAQLHTRPFFTVAGGCPMTR
jgi:hypothetical protein